MQPCPSCCGRSSRSRCTPISRRHPIPCERMEQGAACGKGAGVPGAPVPVGGHGGRHREFGAAHLRPGTVRALPENMLRVFRPTSPMSVGSWVLRGDEHPVAVVRGPARLAGASGGRRGHWSGPARTIARRVHGAAAGPPLTGRARPPNKEEAPGYIAWHLSEQGFVNDQEAARPEREP